jgi:hypothetical protein
MDEIERSSTVRLYAAKLKLGARPISASKIPKVKSQTLATPTGFEPVTLSLGN